MRKVISGGRTRGCRRMLLAIDEVSSTLHGAQATHSPDSRLVLNSRFSLVARRSRIATNIPARSTCECVVDDRLARESAAICSDAAAARHQGVKPRINNQGRMLWSGVAAHSCIVEDDFSIGEYIRAASAVRPPEITFLDGLPYEVPGM